MDALSLTKYLALVWIRPTTGGNNNGRICQRGPASSTAAEHMQLMVGDGTNGSRNGDFSARQVTTGTANVANSPQTTSPDDAWHCIGVHYDDGLAGQRARLFRAGAVQAIDSSISGSGAIDTQAEHPFHIGGEGDGLRPYKGHIANLAIWDVSTLTNTQIDQLVADFYNGGAGSGVAVPQQSLLKELVRLTASGATAGDRSVLASPTVTGALFDSTQSPPVSYSALGGGAVSQTLALSYESVQAVQRSLAGPWEAAQGHSRQLALPYEALQGRAQAASSPYEAPAGVARIAVAQWEAAGQVSALAALPWEALVTGQRALIVPYEALQGVAQATAAPYETLAGITRVAAAPYEAAGQVSRQLPLPWEALAGAQHAAAVPWEALRAITAVAAAPYEAVAGVMRVIAAAWEAPGSLVILLGRLEPAAGGSGRLEPQGGATGRLEAGTGGGGRLEPGS